MGLQIQWAGLQSFFCNLGRHIKFQRNIVKGKSGLLSITGVLISQLGVFIVGSFLADCGEIVIGFFLCPVGNVLKHDVVIQFLKGIGIATEAMLMAECRRKEEDEWI